MFVGGVFVALFDERRRVWKDREMQCLDGGSDMQICELTEKLLCRSLAAMNADNNKNLGSATLVDVAYFVV